MFQCRLCGETEYINYYCEDCSIIRRIVLTYGKLETRNILERVCLRNKKQQNYKITDIKKELENEEKKTIKEVKFDDSSYINPNNPNKDMLDELKKKLKN